MKLPHLWLYLAAALAVGSLSFSAAPALADDGEDDAVYVAPSDDDGSDEAVRSEGESGFDTPGSLYIDEDDYDAGAQDDGTWEPAVPDVPEPEPIEADDADDDDDD